MFCYGVNDGMEASRHQEDGSLAPLQGLHEFWNACTSNAAAFYILDMQYGRQAGRHQSACNNKLKSGADTKARPAPCLDYIAGGGLR